MLAPLLATKFALLFFFCCCCCCWLGLCVFLEVPLAFYGFMMWFAALAYFFSWESVFSFLDAHIQMNF